MFFVNGYISMIKNDDKVFYPACKNETCRRKVVEDSRGSYSCEHCGKSFDSFQPTYMIMARISDFTDSIYVYFTRENGTSLMGKTADQFKEFKDTHTDEQVNNYFDSLLFRPLNIMVKCKFEYYQGEQRMRFFAVKTLPISIGSENRALVNRLQIYSSKQKQEEVEEQNMNGNGESVGFGGPQQDDQMMDGFM